MLLQVTTIICAIFYFLSSEHDPMLLEDVENCYTDQQAFKASRAGGKPPGIRTTLLGVLSPSRSNNHLEKSMFIYLYPLITIYMHHRSR